jgi:hypothetical protein
LLVARSVKKGPHFPRPRERDRARPSLEVGVATFSERASTVTCPRPDLLPTVRQKSNTQSLDPAVVTYVLYKFELSTSLQPLTSHLTFFWLVHFLPQTNPSDCHQTKEENPGGSCKQAKPRPPKISSLALARACTQVRMKSHPHLPTCPACTCTWTQRSSLLRSAREAPLWGRFVRRAEPYCATLTLSRATYRTTPRQTALGPKPNELNPSPPLANRLPKLNAGPTPLYATLTHSLTHPPPQTWPRRECPPLVRRLGQRADLGSFAVLRPTGHHRARPQSAFPTTGEPTGLGATGQSPARVSTPAKSAARIWASL